MARIWEWTRYLWALSNSSPERTTADTRISENILDNYEDRPYFHLLDAHYLSTESSSATNLTAFDLALHRGALYFFQIVFLLGCEIDGFL